jgi:hypothetical protein
VVVGDLTEEMADRLLDALGDATGTSFTAVSVATRPRADGAAVGLAQRILDELETAWRGRVDRMADLLARRSTGAEEDATR